MVKDEHELFNRGLYRRLAEMYLEMARRAASPSIRAYHLAQASEWHEKAIRNEGESSQASQSDR
jgi:hypothetical protein